jgi:molybdopterin molybdotransferase
MMDGYAVKRDDVQHATDERPVRLRVIDEVPAGAVSDKTVKTGQAIRIMTGAPVPEGADAIIIIERTLPSDDGHILVTAPVGENNYIINKGQDLLPGDRVAAAGEPVNAVLMGVLASCGVAEVNVSRRLKIGIISTGSELVSPGTPARPGQIYDINGYSLYGLATEAGAEATFLGVVKDKSDDLLQVLKNARNFDILLLSGGVSVGDYDIVHETLQRADVQEIFWRVKVKPGKPLFFGKMGDTLIFGLPGNPVSCMLCLEEYVRPALRRMMGFSLLHRPVRVAALVEGFDKGEADRRTHFLRVVVQAEQDRLIANSTGAQGSGILSSMVRANALAVVPGTAGTVAPGGEVTVHMTEWPEDH